MSNCCGISCKQAIDAARSSQQYAWLLFADNEALATRIAGQALSKADVNRMVAERCVVWFCKAWLPASHASHQHNAKLTHKHGALVRSCYECPSNSLHDVLKVACLLLDCRQKQKSLLEGVVQQRESLQQRLYQAEVQVRQLRPSLTTDGCTGSQPP